MEDSANSAPIPTSEVKTPRSGKRVFSLAYKRHILAELDACSYLGEKSALLRREGLYSSYICKWREHVADADKSTKKQRKKKGEGGRPRLSAAEREARTLRAENRRLKQELDRAKLAIEVQKKLSELLASFSPETSDDDSISKPSSSS